MLSVGIRQCGNRIFCSRAISCLPNAVYVDRQMKLYNPNWRIFFSLLCFHFSWNVLILHFFLSSARFWNCKHANISLTHHWSHFTKKVLSQPFVNWNCHMEPFASLPSRSFWPTALVWLMWAWMDMRICTTWTGAVVAINFLSCLALVVQLTYIPKIRPSLFQLSSPTVCCKTSIVLAVPTLRKLLFPK